MAVTYTGVMRAINKLTKPLQEKVLKELGLSTKGLPGRTSKKDGITVGKDRVKIEKKIDKLVGGAVGGGIGAGGTVAAYTAGDFINDLLGIKKMGEGTLRAEEKKKVGKSNSETKTNTNKKVIKKTPPKAPPPKPNSIKKNGKKTQQYMTDKSGKATNVKFNSRGGMLKKGKK